MIGIICAMECEIELYKDKIDNCKIININNINFYTGYIGGNEVVISECGIGKVNSSINCSLLIQNFKPKLIINTGIAGGITPLQPNDLFLANEFVYGDFDLRLFGYELGQVPKYDTKFKSNQSYLDSFKTHLNKDKITFKEGLIVTQDSFINSIDQVSNFSSSLMASDMEGASLAHTCKFYDVAFFSIRIISDVIGGEKQKESYDSFEVKAANLSSLISYNFLKENIL